MSVFDFKGRVVLVTGGASGIGRGIVEAFAGEGAEVALTYATSGAGAAEIVAAFGGERVLALQADLTRESECARAVAETEKAYGRIDVLVTNAGGLIARAPTVETTTALWQEAFAVNVLSTVMVCKAALPGMIARRSGAIVTMGSIAAHSGGTSAAHYAAAKGAIHTFTRALAKEVAGSGVRVNGVSPGLIGTRFHDRFSTPDKRQATVAQTPLKREGTPADVAGACLYLACDAASFLTGEIIEVNGGIGMY
ncbi:SDR family NAD(P)-dependent oxidoreductase [Labrys wisconsinensis]|uniref:3-oxoacyl-[acyl-carrier protein] reductase n=1 Tax=Labrys wisconsinensis TaxID=425677 RepID=A0ABU0JB11_9HYPH|nr:glucose 1-dehydrogenase [Labrys wisconsinensis]MDQ0471455.1 3-oxoacyl-[acyl-carrier protein] reductase [Labrys wisconsinensis]